MSTVKLPPVFGSNRIQYECSCGKRKPITRTYFCRHCLKIRCRDCLCHEVDSQYCQHCLEYIPTIDAKLKKNKCSSCFSCPCCEHTLSTKAIFTAIKSETDPNQVVQKKAFYLVCYFCKWTSRDADIADQSTSTGSWPEALTPEATRIDALLDHYRGIAQKEKLEKEKKRINPRRVPLALHLLDKYKMSDILSPNVRAQLYSRMAVQSPTSPLTSPMGQPEELRSPQDMEPSAATDDLSAEALDVDKYYEKEVDLDSISTINQRLVQVELQPEQRKVFHPMSHMLSVKRSLRCKECEHTLAKPEYNPSSIKYKILLATYYHVPEIRLASLPELKPGQDATLNITVQNPTPYPLHVTFIGIDDSIDGINVDISLPQKEVVIGPKDDTLDIDIDVLSDKKKTQDRTAEDTANMVTFRRGNKVGLALPVTLRHDSAGAPRAFFYVKHDFVSSLITVPQESGGEKREPQIRWVSHKIILNLG